MNKLITSIALACFTAISSLASDKETKEQNLVEQIQNLTIQDGIVDVLKDTNGNITVYIGGRGSATANLLKISKVKAEDHALRLAEAAANRAFSEFIQKNIDACLGAKETITDSTMDLDDIVQRMNAVTENKRLASQLLPEDRAAIMKAVLDQVINYIRSSSSVQSVTSLEVRQKANQTVRGMTLFGAHSSQDGNELIAVKVYKWSPKSAMFAAEAEGHNNQKAIPSKKGGQVLNEHSKEVTRKPFISGADDF